jgi:hypothetical protein
MPSILKIFIDKARNLKYNKVTNECESYVEIKWGVLLPNRTLARCGVNPEFGHSYSIESSSEPNIENDPVRIDVVDKTSSVLIGGFYIDLTPLLSSDKSELSGWFPIIDYKKGLRGNHYTQVNLEQHSG